MPVFITPTSAKGKLDCAVERVAADTVKAICENSGNAHSHPTAFSLSNNAGAKLATHDSGGYLLPGIKRGFDLKPADGKIAGGKAKLAATLVDGTTQTYDVTVAD